MTVLQSERILERNVDLSALAQTLARLSRRSERFAPLAIEVSQLSHLRHQLRSPFESFHPDLYKAARRYLESFTDAQLSLKTQTQE